jgi:hypothetical protein
MALKPLNKKGSISRSGTNFHSRKIEKLPVKTSWQLPEILEEILSTLKRTKSILLAASNMSPTPTKWDQLTTIRAFLCDQRWPIERLFQLLFCAASAIPGGSIAPPLPKAEHAIFVNSQSLR